MTRRRVCLYPWNRDGFLREQANSLVIRCRSLAPCPWLNVFISVSLPRNSQSGRRDPVTRTMLPRWELSFYLFASLGFHFYSFYEVFKVSRGKTPSVSELVSRKKGGRGMLAVADSGRWPRGFGVTRARFAFPPVLDSLNQWPDLNWWSFPPSSWIFR